MPLTRLTRKNSDRARAKVSISTISNIKRTLFSDKRKAKEVPWAVITNQNNICLTFYEPISILFFYFTCCQYVLIRTMSSETKSWTDDLPLCNFTGAGFSTNQVYNDDGSRRMEAHKFNERSFHCQVDENT